MGPYLMPHFDTGRSTSTSSTRSRATSCGRVKPDDAGGWGIGNIGPIPEGMVAWFIALAGAGHRGQADRGANRVNPLARLLGLIVAIRGVRAREGRPARTLPPNSARVEHRSAASARSPPTAAPRRWWRGCCCAAAVLAFGFTAIYVIASTNTQLLGLALGGALAVLAVACIVAGKFVVPQETHVEERDQLLVEEQCRRGRDDDRGGGRGHLHGGRCWPVPAAWRAPPSSPPR